ncbi:DUF192 domain-containing protein [Paraliomyxa miuraensis]|uniref:DUF192 domain-containing protein n=1 Tax=Paraliomyxa miuraensis TaxID=376150 RepID=UPI00224FACC1|nr:DUF192 domain-containing protein [Paraliomyxa miuraensis]MCX4239891.1 DUF192 domain-containing protein [Paraliomyxa miuraensis]
MGTLVLAACGGPQSLPCEELTTAQELERVMLVVGDTEVSAEVAVTEEARDSAWVDRRCDLDALLWVPDQVGAVSISLCGVAAAVDLAFLRNGEVVALQSEISPCDAPCDACPIHGATGPIVDAVLWMPTGTIDLAEGDAVEGLDAVPLPTE